MHSHSEWGLPDLPALCTARASETFECACIRQRARPTQEGRREHREKIKEGQERREGQKGSKERNKGRRGKEGRGGQQHGGNRCKMW
jgi:hypothetical protein